MNRIFTLLNETEEVQKGSVKIDVSQIQGNVTFDHVQFGYTDELLMKDVSFQVQSGQMVAIVGPTGAGKTTLMNLLLRFYDVNGGSIKIDGIDIRDMDRSDLRSLFSLVLQDTWLFSGSIFENIRYGSLTARKDEVVDAAKMANIHHYISTLSHGYDSMINEESNNISQGEKQLLTIARANFKKPEDSDSRRSYISSRYPSGTDAPGRNAESHGRANLFCHCPPAFNDTQCRPDPGRR